MDLRTHTAVDRPVHPVALLRDPAPGRAIEPAPSIKPPHRQRLRGAALSLLAAFLGGGLLLPSPAQAAQGPRVQVPQTTTPTSTTTPAFGTITCPPGSQLQSFTPPDACYPTTPVNCVSFEDGFWINRPLVLDKFQPSLGTLRRVRLEYDIEVQGFFCYDNSSNKCCFGGANVGSTAQLEPNNLLNNPPLAQPPVSSVDVAFSITNIVLGPANGQFDCFVPNPGTPTDGTCAGGDYGITNFQATGSLPPIVIEDQVELAKWVASGANNQAFFLSNIQPLIENFFQCNVSTNLDTEARVKLRVTYEYCNNAPPICVGEGAPVVTAEDTPVDIFLLDRVADVDGCIDCSTFQITSQPSHGTLSGFLGCTGQGGTFPGCNDCGQCRVVYTPAPNYCGPDQFSFTVLDDDGAPVTCTVLIQVTPVNDPPVCTKASFQMLEDTFLDIDLCALSSDVDGLNGCGSPLDCNAFVIVNQPSCGGTLAHLGNGVYRFTPPANFCGSCSFTYRAADSGGRLSEPCTVNITVNPVNDPPICSNASFNLAEDTSLLLDLCALVTDPDNANGCGDVFNCNIQIVQQPTCGTLAPQGNGTFLFTPNANFCGQCTFTYRALDAGNRQSGVCTVTLTVTGVNDPPVCVGTTVTTAEDTAVLIDFSQLVTDIDNGTPGCGDPWTCGIQIVSPPSCGVLEEISCAVWRFTPAPNFCGDCSFTFRAVDGGGALSDVCTVNITVTPVNDAPVCSATTVTTAEDTSVLIDFTTLVTDVDNPPNGCGGAWTCGIEIVSPPSCGSLTELSCGIWQFTPTPNACGQCTFTYRARDDSGRASAVCTVTIVITPVNDPPVCTGTTVTTAEDTSVLIDFSGLVTDVDNPPNGCGGAWTCGIEIVSPPTCGTLTEESCAVWRFTPSPNFCGQCTFTYRARDAEGRASNVCTVTVVVSTVNDPPVCVGTTVTTPEDQPVVIDFTLLVSDVDNGTPGCGEPWSCGIEIVSPPSCGTLTEIGCALWQFTPNPNFCGQCTFTFRARDAAGVASQVCTVTLVVTPMNDPPVCVGTSVTTGQGMATLIDLAPFVTDVDNPPNGCGGAWTCGIEIVSPPSCGTLVPAGCATFQFTPFPSFCGSCSFTFRALDAQGRPSEICTVNITVDALNLPPVAVDDFAVTNKNVPVEIPVCVNDSDPNDGTGCGAPLDCCSITYLGDVSCPGAIVEKIVDGGTCKFRFTPPPDFVGTCTFTYRICDTGTPPLCDEAVVTIEIVERCDPTGLRQPGSMLLYPEFDNRNGIVTVYTITNTSRTQDIRVKFWYVNKEDCSTFDRTNYLTALDTLTLVTNFHNPQYEQGFCYVVAMCPSGSTKPVVFNHLAGQMHVLDGIENFGFSINALAFPGIGEGGGMSACGLRFTDVNNNSLHELDGIEYGPAPDEILIPRFFGQDQDYNSELILIGLSGGKQFTTTVDFLVYNDNEQVFSAEHTFYCWTRVNLLDINMVFTADFLRNWTDHDPNEVLGDSSIETGWMRIKGALANSVNTTILNPAIYAVLIERTAPLFEVSDLPWGRCSRETGKLLPKTNSGQ